MASLTDRIDEARGVLNRRRGQLERIREDIVRQQGGFRDTELVQKHSERAQVVIQEVAKLTQEELRYHISDLVTLALASVFDDPYEFEIEFAQKRGQTECELWFVRDGKRVHPLSSTGGGAVEVASFALRVALWSLRAQRNRPILILDEPLKFLKGGDLPEKGARMIKEISDRLGLQIIMISHIPDQIEGADAVHTVTLKKGISYVEST